MNWFKQSFDAFGSLSSVQRLALTFFVAFMMSACWYAFLYKPLQPTKARLEKRFSNIKKQNKNLEGWLDRRDGNFIYEHHLVSPDAMASILQRLFYQVKGLKLVSMKNMPPVSLSKQVKKARNKRRKKKKIDSRHPELKRLLEVKLMAHDIQMVFEGSYFSTLEYLKRIDGLNLPLLWQNIHYESLKYPRAKVTLVMRSLSQEKDWLRA
jgi:hypothetical protein